MVKQFFSIRTLLFNICIAYSLNSYTAHVVFDLGGVLIKTDELASLWHIGPVNFFCYASTLNNPFALRTMLYDFLHFIHDDHPIDNSYDDKGLRLPQIICNWLKGTKRSSEIYVYLEQSLQRHQEFFTSNLEHSLIRSLIKVIFHPQKFINTRMIIQEGIDFVQECKQMGHHVYILSNWDPESFNYLQLDYPEFLALFDDIIISGNVGLLKPDTHIYQHFLTKHNVLPDQCIYIDDQPENIEAAQKLGITSIICPRKNSLWSSGPDFSFVKRHFYSLEASPLLDQ